MKYYDEFIDFLITTFAFVEKSKIATVLNLTLNNAEYFLALIGIWIVVIILIWFVFYLIFKLKSWF